MIFISGNGDYKIDQEINANKEDSFYSIVKENGNLLISFSKADMKSVYIKCKKVGQPKVYGYYARNNRIVVPLSCGMGTYEIKICKNKKEDSDSYYLIDKKYIQVSEYEALEAKESSNEKVYYDDSFEAVKMARALTTNCKSDKEKLEKIYKYIVENYTYDYNKLNEKETGYTPDIEQVYRDKKGICYDYAVLLAAMLRAVGVKAEVVIGYVNTSGQLSCHAWNKVFIGENKSYMIVDTTTDAASYRAGSSYSIGKDKKYYSNVSKVY